MACMAGDMAYMLAVNLLAPGLHQQLANAAAPAQGLGLDPCTCSVLESWGLGAQLEQNSVPMEIEENRIITNRAAKVVLRDQQRRNRR